MSIKSICYKYSDGEAIVCKPTDWAWGSGETAGALRVADIDITQDQVDTIFLRGE